MKNENFPKFAFILVLLYILHDERYIVLHIVLRNLKRLKGDLRNPLSITNTRVYFVIERANSLIQVMALWGCQSKGKWKTIRNLFMLLTVLKHSSMLQASLLNSYISCYTYKLFFRPLPHYWFTIRQEQVIGARHTGLVRHPPPEAVTVVARYFRCNSRDLPPGSLTSPSGNDSTFQLASKIRFRSLVC